MTVRIVTDSTADIPADQAEALGITIVPLAVFFGDETYLDGVDLNHTNFYKKMQESKDLPRTSQPPPAAFQKAFTDLIQEGAESILSIHLSSKLSGTYQSACNARDSLPEDLKKIPIEIIDSRSVSIGMLPTILQVADEAKRGKSLADLQAQTLDQLSHTRVLAVLDTLEFVKRGGRIGGAKAFLGNMLSVKPIISLKDGEVIPLEQPRTRSKAYARIAQLVGEMGTIEKISLAESGEEVGQQLAEALKTTYRGEIAFYKLGAALGTHTGPGTAAVAITLAH